MNQIIKFFSHLVFPISACQDQFKSIKKVAQVGNGKKKRIIRSLIS